MINTFIITTSFLTLLLPFFLSADQLKTNLIAPDTIINNTNISELESDSVKTDSISRLQNLMRYIFTANEISSNYTKHPQNPDTIFSISQHYPNHLYQSDESKIATVIRSHPFYISIPFTFPSSLDKLLFMGFPVPLQTFQNSGSHLLQTDPSIGINTISTVEFKNIFFEFPNTIIPIYQPDGIVKGETQILWENGPFGENNLSLRFSRPITPLFRLCITTDYNHFNQKNFTRSRGDIYNSWRELYYWFGRDTTSLVNQGTNPLTDEFIGKIVGYFHRSNLDIHATYSYTHLQNEIAFSAPLFDFKDQYLTDTIGWKLRGNYSHLAALKFSNIIIGKKLGIQANIDFSSSENRINPRKSEPYSTIIATTKGNMQKLSGSLLATIPYLRNDTLSLSVSTVGITLNQDTSKKETITNSHCAINTSLTVENNNLINTLDLKAGVAILATSDSLHIFSEWQLKNIFTKGWLNLNLSFEQKMLDPSIPYDFISQHQDATTIVYRHFAYESTLSGNLLGISLGYHHIKGIDDSIARKYWPSQTLPYTCANNLLAIAPHFGPWQNLTLQTNWILADKRPIIKNHTKISWDAHKKETGPFFTMTTGFVYWSQREKISFGGITGWNETIIDLYLKASLQIHTFRLFYKMNNLGNRKISYVPGYTSSGVVFQWGFNWIIQG